MKQINILRVILEYPTKNKLTQRARLIALAGIVLFMVACEDDYSYYDTNNAIVQFGPEQDFMYRSSYNLADTVKAYTFVYEASTVKQDTVYFDLYVLGGPTATDRSFIIKQVMVNDTLNAEPSYNFV